MTSYTRIFFAGVGTTFAILAIGFGAGVLLATTAMKDNGSVVRAKSQTAVSAVRVVHPASNEPAAQVPANVLKPQPPPVQPAYQGVTMSEPSQAQPDDYQKTKKELRAEKRRERAERRAEQRERRFHWESLPQREPTMMAFGNGAR
jgi:hypothetical protein